MAGVAVNGEARAQAGMGADAGDYDGDGRIDLALTAFAHDRNTLYRNVDGGTFEDASAPAGLATSTFAAHGLGHRRSSTPTSTAGSICSSPTATSSPTSTLPRSSARPTRRRASCCSTAAARFRDVSAGAGRGLQVAAVSRGLAVGDLDDDGDPDVVAQQHGRRADAAREPPAHRPSLDRVPARRRLPATASRSARR